MRTTAAEHKKLCKKIHRDYGKRMGLSYFESCEACDDVWFNQMSVERLTNLMEAALADTETTH